MGTEAALGRLGKPASRNAALQLRVAKRADLVAEATADLGGDVLCRHSGSGECRFLQGWDGDETSPGVSFLL